MRNLRAERDQQLEGKSTEEVQQMIADVHDDSHNAADRIIHQLQEGIAIGNETAEELARQDEQIDSITKDAVQVEAGAQRANRLLDRFARWACVCGSRRDAKAALRADQQAAGTSSTERKAKAAKKRISATKGRGGGGGGGGDGKRAAEVEMGEQEQEERDSLDEKIDAIGNLVDQLGDIAVGLNDEMDKQSHKIVGMHDQMTAANNETALAAQRLRQMK